MRNNVRTHQAPKLTNKYYIMVYCYQVADGKTLKPCRLSIATANLNFLRQYLQVFLIAVAKTSFTCLLEQIIEQLTVITCV